VVFMPAGNRRLAWNYPCPAVGTVHDFSSLHVAGKYDRARMFYIKTVLPALTRRLDRVLTVSESSKKDIVDYARFPADRVTVTHLAADPGAFSPGDGEASKKRMAENHGLDAPYFVYISRIEHPGKNHATLIRAFDRFRRETPDRAILALAGSDWNRAEEVHAEAVRSEFRDDIRFLGFVPDEDTADLYRGSRAMIFPSLYEGFGLPLLEAMGCGTPVACSNCSSLPEVAGDAALLFDPTNDDDLAGALERLWKDDGIRERCCEEGLKRAATFSWQRTAELTLETLERAHGEGRHGR